MDFLSEGVFGSIDGRARSTSGSTVWRSAGAGRPGTSASSDHSAGTSYPFDRNASTMAELAPDLFTRLAACNESSDAGQVDECLTQLAAHLDASGSGMLAADRAWRALSRNVPCLLAHFKWYVRARAYKLLRRLASPRPLEYCREYMELSIMHTLSMSDEVHGVHEEREQALKFIRWTMRFDQQLWVLGPRVVKAMMAVAEQADDRMRGVCLETLCECLVLAPERLWYVGGLRTLTLAALDGPWVVSVTIASALAHVFDSAETRRFVHAGMALGGIVSALTESPGKDQALAERAKIAAFMLTQLLKSWGGLQYFLSDGRRAIRALVEALALADANAKIILGMLLELFGLSDDFDAVQFEQQPRFDVELLSPFHLPAHAITQQAARTRLLPVDYLRTLLLTVFIEAGLVEALVSASLESPQAEVVDASATLLKWLAQNPRMPLPETHVARFQTLGDLVAAALKDESSRALAARRVVEKIEAIPSLSMGQLPSQQTDIWAASISSSALYHQFLRQRRLRLQLRSSKTAAERPAADTAHASAVLAAALASMTQNAEPVASSTTAATAIPSSSSSSFSSSAMGMSSVGGGTGSGGSLLSKPMLQLGSASVVGGHGSKGLAAGLKDNAARVLRSSASTGNLRSGSSTNTSVNGSSGGGIGISATPAMSLLGTVNEDAPLFKMTGQGNMLSDTASIISSRSRRSLDVVRNHQTQYSQQQQQQQQQSAMPMPMPMPVSRGAAQSSGGMSQFISALSPYVHVDASPVLQPSSASIYSQNGATSAAVLSAPVEPAVGTPFGHHFLQSSSSLSAGAISSGSAMPVPAPPLIARTRTKSRSRSRNSIVMVNSMGAEETPLQALIQESRVLSEENPMRWDWETVRAIILGPMAATRRLSEELTTSGFLSRLSRFFHPASLEFCDLSRTTANEEYLEIGRHLIRTLVSSADGLLLIDESRLLAGIVEEIRKQTGQSVRKSGRDESCFSFARLQMTMSPGYFYFLAEIDSTVGGDSLLERNRLFDVYYQVVEASDQVLLIQYVLSSMSYAGDGHARNILRKVASSPHEPLRMLVPSYLLYLSSDVACRPGSVTAWAIDVLLALLYDSSPVVRSSAAQCLVLMLDMPLENPYLPRNESGVRIAYLLDHQPMFDLAVITDIRVLIQRLVGTQRGFEYLWGQGVVESEMEAWGALEGIYYVQSIELDISRALAFGPLFSSTPDGSMTMTSNPQTPPTPAHLFGELVKSAGGREFLQQVGIPRLLFETLGNIPWNSALGNDVAGLKATLWAIGAMGASKEGYLLIEPFDAFGKILEVARQAKSMSIKGTCLYALGLLSRSQFAAETFKERGWRLCSSCYGLYEYAVPSRLEAILNADDWAAGGILDGTIAASERDPEEAGDALEDEDLDSVQKEILDSIVMMSNHMLANPASKTIMRLRTSHPHYFRLLPLYRKVIGLLARYRYRLSTRRFIYNVFDVNLAILHRQAIDSVGEDGDEHGSSDGGGGGGGGGSARDGVARRFSSSVSSLDAMPEGNGDQKDGDSRRKRASTLQEYSSLALATSSSLSSSFSSLAAGAGANQDTVFSRRPTNALLEDIRPSNRRNNK
ncbi:hypothetical protein LPJ56_000531 [Coemansia sp. RSA 2599]|nr:hypothetical protein LPJ75_000219 [Coemansia sp. RSA 2598]KAJ1829229.1 hypothetical protein LPJ56_000531 [Coemansia sp. RSA 2599]